MIKMSHYFTDVQAEEYETMFAFYVTQLGFDYIVCDYDAMKGYLEQLNAEGKLNVIIEGLKIGNQCVLYLNEHAEEGYCEPLSSYKKVL